MTVFKEAWADLSEHVLMDAFEASTNRRTWFSPRGHRRRKSAHRLWHEAHQCWSGYEGGNKPRRPASQNLSAEVLRLKPKTPLAKSGKQADANSTKRPQTAASKNLGEFRGLSRVNKLAQTVAMRCSGLHRAGVAGSFPVASTTSITAMAGVSPAMPNIVIFTS